jgi:hypothetical protein
MCDIDEMMVIQVGMIGKKGYYWDTGVPMISKNKIFSGGVEMSWHSPCV